MPANPSDSGVVEGTSTDAERDRITVDDPRRFGNYELRRKLGVGGMAETVVAVRRGPGGFEQEVCLKRILPAFALDERFLEMFLSEARLAARLRHNNVVQVYDFGEEQGVYYLALELVDGLDLRGLLSELKREGQRVDPDMLVYIVYELLAALAYAHDLAIDGSAAGLVHRDVTPSNVLISVHGEVKLTDFGIAKATHSNNATQTGSIKGKIPYMAPEQAQGQRVDKRTDLFAVGVILYEALAGKRPFDGATDTATLLNIARGSYTPLDELEPSVKPALRFLVDGLLKCDPEERIQSAQEAADLIVDLVPPPLVRRSISTLVSRLRKEKLAHVISPTEVATRKPTPSSRPLGAGTASGVRPSEEYPPPAIPNPAIPNPAIPNTVGAPGASAAPGQGVSHDALGGVPATRLSGGAPVPPGLRSETDALRGPVRPGIARVMAFAGGALTVLLLLAGGYWATSLFRGPGEANEAPQPQAELAGSGDSIVQADNSDPPSPPRAGAGNALEEAEPSAPATANQQENPSENRSDGSEANPAQTATPETSMAATAAAEPAEPARPAQATTTAAATEQTPRHRAQERQAPSDGPGYIRVYVVPYGNAWIDGRPVSTQTFVQVRPGRHRVHVGHQGVTDSRSVVVRSGQRKDVQFMLSSRGARRSN